jgi:diguanylate cyclase (GGDEF)-like protein
VIEVDGVPVGVQGVCRDITARRRAEVELHAALAANTRLALHDQLTGLPNRACFYERVAEALDPPGSAAGLLFLDLDRFKEINDTLGHHAGDAVLAELGARLRRAFRVEDTVARLGGDEFAVLLTGPDDMRRASEDAVERIAEALEQPFLVEGLSIAVEASIGIALHPEHGADTGTLLRRADAAMYAAKRAGVTHAFHDRTLERRDTQRLALVGELRRALERRELFLHYQPEAATADGGVAAVEALVRWRHPERGTLGPAEFIPFAEQTGMIRPLTRFVLDEALAQQRRWRRAGLDTRVAVNVAACSLLEDGFAEHVEHLLDRYDTPAGALIVEVTERAMIHDPDRARVALARLRRAGVVVALDDFGSGHSSLEQLGRLPLDQIKIGRAIAGSAATDRTSAAIVRAIVDLAHELGLEVVAEGIESGAAWDLVRALGADYVQGFHVSRPVAAARVPGLLQRAGDHGVAA